MNFALCYRGISFRDNYRNESHLSPYKIDFDSVSHFHYENVIKPLRERGDVVDIFFNTYDSIKLQDYKNQFQPVDVLVKDFNAGIVKYNFNHVCELIISTLQQVKDYENRTGKVYDYIILNRFDIVIFSDFTKCFIIEDGVSVPTINDDCFIVYHKSILEKAIWIYKTYQNQLITHHMVFKFIEHGIKYHSMFPNKPGDEVGFNGPFWRLERVMFNPDGHNVKEYNFYDVFNKNSKWFGFKYEPNKEFFDCKKLI
jgi:hypothetical protein